MKNYHVECKPHSDAVASFCTSRAGPEANKEEVQRITLKVTRFLGLNKIGMTGDATYQDALVLHVIYRAVADVFIGRHFGISEDAMLAYLHPMCRESVVMLANEVAL
jgi:hypothetical protein